MKNPLNFQTEDNDVVILKTVSLFIFVSTFWFALHHLAQSLRDAVNLGGKFNKKYFFENSIIPEFFDRGCNQNVSLV
jgi:hypothetical protein